MIFVCTSSLNHDCCYTGTLSDWRLSLHPTHDQVFDQCFCTRLRSGPPPSQHNLSLPLSLLRCWFRKRHIYCSAQHHKAHENKLDWSLPQVMSHPPPSSQHVQQGQKHFYQSQTSVSCYLPFSSVEKYVHRLVYVRALLSLWSHLTDQTLWLQKQFQITGKVAFL